MARLLVARAKFRFRVASKFTVLAAAAMLVASSQPSAAQNGRGPAYTYNGTPTAIPNLPNQKKSWTDKVGDAWSKGWRKTTGAVKKLAPKKRAKSPINDAVRLASKTPPINADLHASMAVLYMEKGRNDIAIKHFEQAFKLDPKNLKAIRGYGRYLEQQGRVAEAESRFRRATNIDANSPGAWNDLGMCLARQGKRVEAAGTIERAVRLRPKKALYRNNLSAVLIELGDTKRALGHLAQAHGEAKAHYNVGVLLSRKGDQQAAQFHFKRALDMDGSLVAARQWLASMNAGPRHERVAQRPIEVRRPVRAPVARPVVTRAPRVPATTQRAPSAADNFWGSPSTTPTGPTQTPPPTNQFTPQPRTAAPIRVPPTQPPGGRTAADKFWGKPSVAPAQQSSPPSTQFSPPARPQFALPPTTAPTAVVPPSPTPARTMPSQQFQPYKLGSAPTPGRRPTYVSDPRFAPTPTAKYTSPLKFGRQSSPYGPQATVPYR